MDKTFSLLLRRHLFFYIVQFAAILIAIYWFGHSPAPGYAIGSVAVLAAVMTIHGEMNVWHKALWMLIIGAFLTIEFRAINHDREDFSAREAQKREAEAKSFREVAAGIAKAVDQNQRHFEATIRGMRESLAVVTGGNTYPVITAGLARTPDGATPLLIIAEGKYNLFDLNLSVRSHVNRTDPQSILRSINDTRSVYVPMVNGNRAATISNLELHPEGEVDVYQIDTRTRNGEFTEMLTLTHTPEGWKEDVVVSDWYGHTFADTTHSRRLVKPKLP